MNSEPAIKQKSPYYQGYYAALKYGGRNPFSNDAEPEKHEAWNQGYDDGAEEDQQNEGCHCDH